MPATGNPRYEIELIHKAHDWDATFTMHAPNKKGAENFAKAKLAAPADWIVTSVQRAIPTLTEIIPSTAPELLTAAASHMAERAKTYDQPEGERSIAAVVAAFNSVTGRAAEQALSESEGWLFMQLLKIVRDRAGKPHRDSIEDNVAYASLYGEARLKELA